MKEAGHDPQRASFILHPSILHPSFSTLGRRSTFGYAAVGGVLLWAALPPLGLWPLAWIAPIWWVLLVAARNCRRWQPIRRAAPPVVLLIAWVLLFAG